MPDLSIGLTSSTQGSYAREQALLDIGQGTRVSRSTYDPKDVPPVGLVKMVNGSGSVKGWDAIVERADTAPQTIVPGLLASTIPGGVAYVGDATRLQETVIPAADRIGRISSLALADTSDTARRTEAEAREYGLVVVATSPGSRWPAGTAPDPQAPGSRTARDRDADPTRRADPSPAADRSSGTRRRTSVRADLGHHEPAEPGRRNRHRSDDPRPPRSRYPGRHARPGHGRRRRTPARSPHPPPRPTRRPRSAAHPRPRIRARRLAGHPARRRSDRWSRPDAGSRFDGSAASPSSGSRR